MHFLLYIKRVITGTLKPTQLAHCSLGITITKCLLPSIPYLVRDNNQQLCCVDYERSSDELITLV